MRRPTRLRPERLPSISRRVEMIALMVPENRNCGGLYNEAERREFSYHKMRI
jgi:hypothetical protein